MKKLYLVFAASLLTLGMSAQSLTPQVIASTGGFSSNNNGSLSYTVGEMTMVQTFSANGNILTQGFQQPNDTSKILGLVNITQDEFGSFVVYPNPAIDNAWLGFEMPEAGRVTISLFDILGQKVTDLYEGNYTNGTITDKANVNQYASGVYFVTLNFVSALDGKTHVTTKKLQVIR